MAVKTNMKNLLDIYIAFLKIGSISFGGGYSVVSIMERKVVAESRWVDKEKFIDILAVAQSLPGAVALNSSAFVGFAVAGIPGAIAALLGNLTAPVLIVVSLMLLFMQVKDNPFVKSAFTGIYPAIVGLIIYAAVRIGKAALKEWISIIITLAAFLLSVFLKISPIPLILSGAVLGIAIRRIQAMCVFDKGKRQERENL